MGRERRWRLMAAAATAALAVGLAGCGSGTHLLSHSSSSTSRVSRGRGVPTGTVAVIRGWSNALRDGHVDAAARFFHLPSVFSDGGGPPVIVHTLAEAESVNAALPCGATLLSTHRQGQFVNALFRLGNRPGQGGAGGCGTGAGETARTDFVIAHGLILEWLRAPDEPGDNGSPRTTPTTPTSPEPANGFTPVA